jgi:hypothetical protein
MRWSHLHGRADSRRLTPVPIAEVTARLLCPKKRACLAVRFQVAPRTFLDQTGGMDSRDLAPAKAIDDRPAPYVRYLGRVRRRMDARGFPHTDELLRAADKAYSAARDLSITLHYLSCQSGVGRAPRTPPPIGPFAAWGETCR